MTNPAQQGRPIQIGPAIPPLRNVIYGLGVGAIIVASFCPLIERVPWTIFGVMFLISADSIKDVEKAKKRERDCTIIEMKTKALDEWEESLDGRQTFMVEQVRKGVEMSLGQVSTYVKDASPTNAAALRVTTENDEPNHG